LNPPDNQFGKSKRQSSKQKKNHQSNKTQKQKNSFGKIAIEPPASIEHINEVY